MTSMPQDFKNIIKSFGHFRIFIPVQILLDYHNIDSSHCLGKYVQRVIDKVFREQFMDY